MKIYQDNIDQQFEFNQGKNLFNNGILNSLRFSKETLDAIKDIDLINSESENLLIDYLTNRAIQEFCKINQYYTFDNQAKIMLRNLYVDLFTNIKNHEDSINLIATKHYDNLIKWLQETNSFAEKIYNSKEELIQSVVCSEYSPELQIKILQIDIDNIIEPVLDIGCGRKGDLVLYLRQKGIEAYGFDRFAYKNSFLINSDWFEYKFEREKWGTITSNLGFSNHFQHHHFRNDGNFIDYAKKYMDILNSLKIGGSFHYAPDLPFIEQYLDLEKYKLMKENVCNYKFKSMKIERLK
ncbi:MAG: hypothetical protein VB048_09465 [Bacteroidaceae bacterium]|nr:hypothetical protein [Bacteroidaceae bacterium]MEA5099504.1 hypothetical protein [Bacteroidales bacterium]